jgi:hypothetical protein
MSSPETTQNWRPVALLPCAWWPHNSLSLRDAASVSPQTPHGLWLHAASEQDGEVEASGVNVLLDRAGVERLRSILGEWMEANR